MHPIIFSSKIFELHTLWVFFAIALITSTVVLIRLSIKEGLKIQFISDNAWKIVIWGIIGARIAGILTNYDNYFYDFNGDTLLRFFHIWDKGLELWGGIIAAIIYFHLLCNKSSQNFWKWMDVLIPATILGLGIEQIGLFFDGANYGTPSSLPWAVNFENPAIKYSVPIHPTQIYGFLYSILVFIGLILVRHYETGLLALGGTLIYSLLHFLEEFIRGDDTIMIFSIRLGQISSFLIMITAGIMIYLRYFKKVTTRLHSKKI